MRIRNRKHDHRVNGSRVSHTDERFVRLISAPWIYVQHLLTNTFTISLVSDINLVAHNIEASRDRVFTTMTSNCGRSRWRPQRIVQRVPLFRGLVSYMSGTVRV